MATETLELKAYGCGSERKPDTLVVVEYVEVPHYLAGLPFHGKEFKAYEVRVGGKVIGKVRQAELSTDRHAGNIRIPGRGRLGWEWSRKGYLDERGNPVCPLGTVYGNSTRRNATARLLGYDEAEAVKLGVR